MEHASKVTITDAEWDEAIEINSDRDVTDYRGVCETIMASRTAILKRYSAGSIADKYEYGTRDLLSPSENGEFVLFEDLLRTNRVTEEDR